MSTSKLAVIEPRSTEIEALAGRIVPAFPRDCSPEQAAEVARIALAYGLDPFLGELIPYQGRPYLTLEGRTRVAENNPHYDGYEHGPVTGEELKAHQPKPGEVIWRCTVYRKDRSHPTVAYGRAGGPNERNPVAKTDPVTMAQKRAIHRALRAAFPVPIPGEIARDDDPLEPRATPEQIKAIHAVDDAQGVTISERHDELEAQFAVGSSKELTAGQASAYLDQRRARATAETTPEPAGIDPNDPLVKSIDNATTTLALDRIWQSIVRSRRDTTELETHKAARWGALAMQELLHRLNARPEDIRWAMEQAGFATFSDIQTPEDVQAVEAAYLGDPDASSESEGDDA